MIAQRPSRGAAHPEVSDGSPDASTLGDLQTSVTGTTQVLEAALFAQPRPMLFERIGSAIAWIALVKVSIVAAATFVGIRLPSSGTPLAPAFYVATFAAFAAVGTWLVVGASRDRGARFLGAFFLLTALACARGASRAIAGDLSGGIAAALLTDLDPLLPVCLWLFAREFPGRLRRGRQLAFVRFVLTLCAVSAAVLLTVNFIWATGRTVPTTLLVGSSNVYSGLTFGLTALAFPYLVFRCVRTSADDRVRASWMLLGLLVGLSPLVLEVVAGVLSPAFGAWAFSADIRPILGAILFGFLLTLPFTTAYAVLTHQTLDVRIVLRRALQCSLTKYACAFACLMPLAYLSWLAYRYRHLTVADIALLPTTQLALAAAFFGIVGLFLYPHVLVRVDQLFFGPTYDERRVRTEFQAAIWKSANAPASAALLARAATSVLASERASVLLRDPIDRSYRDAGSGDVLTSDSKLLDIVARDRRGVVPVTDVLLASVTDDDLRWIARTTPLAVVPIRSSANDVLAVLSVALRKTGRPYYSEDWHLLTDLASYASSTFERHLTKTSRQVTRAASDVPAAECPACGLVESHETAVCRQCATPLEVASLPALVNGKYTLQSRIGRGGMGVVYRARDEMLDRTVALKTVPFISDPGEHRSVSEGRLMAGFLHHHLVTVFAFERSLGRSVLVLEWLEGGTLKDRLACGPLPVAEAVDVTLKLCDGLTWLHRQGITHGDIKPSNVGFSASGLPKLLDFGLAQVTAVDAVHSKGQGVRGTLQYCCPFGSSSSPASNDLWALAVVLFECLAGRRLFDVLPTPPHDHVPDVRLFQSEVSPELAAVLSRALSPDSAVRPQSAGEFRLWLERTRPI